MKKKWRLIASIVQLVVGLLAIAAFAVLAWNGESMVKWIITLLLAVAYVVLGVIGIIDYKSNK